MKTQLEHLQSMGIPACLLDAGMIEAARKRHNDAQPTNGSTPWEHWTDKTGFKPYLYLRAESYNPMPDIFDGSSLPLKFGDWTIDRVTHKKDMRLRLYQKRGERDPALGWVQFDGTVQYPALTHRSRGCIMSLSPHECISVKAGARFAKGHVVITGLGLGYLAWMVAKRPQVKSITVIEIDLGVRDAVWPRLKPHLQCRNVACHVGDCNALLPELNGDVLLADHFDGYGWNGDWLDYRKDGKAIKSRFGKIWTWG